MANSAAAARAPFEGDEARIQALRSSKESRANTLQSATDIKTKAERPTHGMHPWALRLAVVAAAWFVIAMAISFSGSLEADYLLTVTVGFAVIFYGLMIGLGVAVSRDRRWGGEEEVGFDEFLHGNVAIATGRVEAREVLFQLLTLPVSLALGATAIGLVFVLSQ